MIRPFLFIPLCAGVIVLGAGTEPWAQGRGGGGGQQAVDRTVPASLPPLLTPAPSEMDVVVGYYEADRRTLEGNFAAAGSGRGGGGRGGRGRGGGQPQNAPAEPEVTVPSMSTARISRLRQFDANWLEALRALDTSTLSEAARQDHQQLVTRIEANRQALDADLMTIRELSPLLPFRQAIVDLAEARIRIEEIDSQAAAGQVNDVINQVAGIRGDLEAGTVGAGRDAALRAARAVTDLAGNLEDWFEFRDGYDPLFTWWMRMPYAEASEALTGYAAYLRETVAPADRAAAMPAPQSDLMAPPADGPNSVPDLAMLVSLPHDELTDIVARFRAGAGGGRGAPPAGADYYRDWLRALETLDFDGLSRTAQVNYLYLRRLSELRIERDGVTLPANPPRKTDDSGIEGPARGEQGLLWDLQDELVPYSADELIALAEVEFAWADAEMLRASRELGFGDDWKAALEHVKTLHPPPGGQPQAIKEMLFEAVDYLREHDLLTVPQVAVESFHMSMMSPERQLVNPFFTGGSRITVSYPTDTMTYDQRMQSMRGNNTPFSHATAHHEMIPGHNLTGYMSQRFGDYRANLGAGTPFFSEGWALYWELMLYARGFNDTPEERIGALFWRMHRCARIIFSLNFHMGHWSPQEAIDFLVDRVGHERENAIAEVRRSFGTSYSPLYQAAYLLGGLQLRALHGELVESGRMSEKAFHDEILRQGNMPVALHKLILSDEPLTRDMSLDWRWR